MSLEILAILMFILIVLALIGGVPVAFSLGGVAVIFGLIIYGPDIFYQFTIATWGVMKMYSLLAVPLFIFMGSILANSGIASRLYESMHILLGGFKGGLAVTTIIICIFFGACTGVIGASVVTMALIAIPGMLERGYSKELISGTITSGGCLGMVIPPSIMLILYGSEAGTSISSLFAASLIPGVLLGIAYAVYIAVRCKINPSMGPSIPSEERSQYTGKQIWKMLVISIIPIFILIFLVLGSIMIGIAAPSEAASLGAIGALVISAFYRKLNIKILKESIIVTLKTTSMVVFIVLGAKYFTGVFFRMGGHNVIKDVVGAMDLSPAWLLMALLIVLFILGMFMDWIGLMMVFIPIFNPIILSLGYNPVWYGIIFSMVMCISLLTPPFAYAIFYLKGVAPPEISLTQMYKGVIPFLIIHIALVVMIFIFPQLTLWFPTITGLE